MSAYTIMKICRQADRDPRFRKRLKNDPAGTIADFELTSEERDAFLTGNVKRLHELGAHGFLLSRLAMFGIVGLTVEDYALKMRGPVD
jgi:hypothetical protein